MATINGIKVGTTTITASYTDGGVTKTATASITVSAIAPTLSFTKTATDIIYDGARKAIGTVSYNGDGQAYYLVIKATSQPSTPAADATTGTGWVSVSNGGTVYATKSGVASGAGTYWVFLKSTAITNGNYTAVNPKYGNNKEILKATGSFGTLTNPAAQTYKCDNTAYSFTIGFSGATGAVSYPTSITVKKGSTSVSGWSISSTTVTAPAGTAAGTYTVTGSASVAASDNYNAVSSTSKSWTITINQASDASVTAALSTGTLTYAPSTARTLASVSATHGMGTYYLGYKKGSAATADNQITWGTANANSITAIDAGNYYVYYKFTSDSNHSNDKTYTQVGTTYRTIGKATGSSGSVSNPSSQNYKTSGTYSFQLGISGATGSVTYPTSITVKDSSNNTVSNWTCTSAGVVTVPAGTNAGAYTVTGNVTVAASSDGNYNAVGATSKTWTITINKIAGTLGAASTISAKTFSTSTQTAQLAVGSSTGTVHYPTSITVKNSSNTTITGWSCTSAGVVTIPASTTVGSYTVTGNCTVDASTNYNAVSATGRTWTITINKADGSFGTATSNPASATYKASGTHTFTIGFSGNTGTVTYPTSISVTKDGSSVSGWSISGTTVTTASAPTVGTYTVTGNASVAAATNYNAVASTSKSWTFTINKADGYLGAASTITAQNYKTSGTYSFQLAVGSSSGNVTYPTSITVKDSSNNAVSNWTCTSAGVVTVPAGTNAGSYTVTGNCTVAASTNYNAVGATSRTWTITINKIAGSFGTATSNPSSATYKSSGTHSITIGFSGNTGAVTYPTSISVTKGSSSVSGWSISGTTVTTASAPAAGTYTITGNASVAASTNYNAVASTSKSWTFTINKANGTLGAASTISSKTFSTSSQTFQLAVGSSTGSVTYPTSITVKDSNNNTVSGWTCTSAGVLTVPASTTVGSYTVTGNCTVAEATNYNAVGATSRTWTITITKATGYLGASSTIAAQNYKTSGTYSYQLAVGSSSGTVSYPTSITVKQGSTTITGWSCTSAGVVTVPAGTNAGSYTVTGNCTVATSTNYNAVGATSRTWTITINKIAGTLGAASSIAAKTFSTSSQTAQLAVGTSTGTVTYPTSITVKDSNNNTVSGWTCTSAGVVTIPASTTVGSYTVTGNCTVAEATNYNAVGATSRTWTITINKATGYLGAASSIAAKTFSTSSQTAQLAVGSSSGAVSYPTSVTVTKGGSSVSGWTCTSAGVLTIPASATAGTYTVKGNCTVAASTNYNAVSATERSWTITINKANITPTVSMSGYTYGGTKSSPSVSGNTGSGSVTYYYNTTNSNSGGTAWTTVTSSTTLNAGTYYMYAVIGETTNYNGATTATKSFTISKATGSPGTVTNPAAQTYKASGTYSFTIGISGATGTVSYPSSITVKKGSTSVSGWSISGTTVTVPAGTGAGTYTVTGNITVAEATNYNAVGSTSKSWTITINKATQSAPTATGASVIYNNTATASASGGGSHGSIEWSNGSSRTAIGSQNTTARWSGDDNYEPSPYSSAVTLTVSKYTPSITLTATSRAYNGNPLYATATVVYPSGGKTPKGTIYYGTSSGATTYSVTYNGSTVNLTNVSVTNYNDSTTVYAYFVPDSSCNDVYNNSANASKSFSINAKAASTLPTTISGDSKAYHNTARATVSKDYTGGTLKYSTDNGSTWNNVTWSSGNYTANPSRTSLGETSVKFKVVGDSNHSDSNVSSAITLTIYEASDARMTVNPSENLTYNNANQTIATASDLEGIATYYLGYRKGSEATSDGQVTWTSNSNTTPLQAKDAGTYYVYYKFTSDSNHSNNKEYTLVGSVVINKASITPTVTMSGYTYGGTKSSPGITSGTNPGNGSVTYYYNTTNSNSGGTAWSTVTSSTSLNAGTYYMYAVVDETSNYYGATTATKSFVISKANGTVTYSVQTPVEEWCISTASPASTAQGNKTVTIATSSATGTGTVTYSISQSGWSIASDGKTITIPSGAAASTYSITVWANAASATNYNAASVSKAISVKLKANALETITLALGASTIAFNATTTATVVASYTNGKTADVTTAASYTTNPSNIVSIS